MEILAYLKKKIYSNCSKNINIGTLRYFTGKNNARILKIEELLRLKRFLLVLIQKVYNSNS